MKSVGNTTMDENPKNEMEEIEFGRQYKCMWWERNKTKVTIS
jgi:hypothetical protein